MLPEACCPWGSFRGGQFYLRFGSPFCLCGKGCKAGVFFVTTKLTNDRPRFDQWRVLMVKICKLAARQRVIPNCLKYYCRFGRSFNLLFIREPGAPIPSGRATVPLPDVAIHGMEKRDTFAGIPGFWARSYRYG